MSPKGRGHFVELGVDGKIVHIKIHLKGIGWENVSWNVWLSVKTNTSLFPQCKVGDILTN
jgi:hypothetical protein